MRGLLEQLTGEPGASWDEKFHARIFLGGYSYGFETTKTETVAFLYVERRELFVTLKRTGNPRKVMRIPLLDADTHPEISKLAAAAKLMVLDGVELASSRGCPRLLNGETLCRMHNNSRMHNALRSGTGKRVPPGYQSG
jgi:hypothetical protein